MTHEISTSDVFIAVVPQNIDPTAPGKRSELVMELTKIAEEYVLRQWSAASVTARPDRIRDLVSDWLITNNPEEVAEFQPTHDCTACIAGNDQALTFLREHPGRWVAVANLSYVEVWS